MTLVGVFTALILDLSLVASEFIVSSSLLIMASSTVPEMRTQKIRMVGFDWVRTVDIVNLL